MAEELRDDQRSSLLAFLARYADMHGEMIYDDSDCYCHLGVKYDPERGYRQISSGTRDYVIYFDREIEETQALELVRQTMIDKGWPFPD